MLYHYVCTYTYTYMYIHIYIMLPDSWSVINLISNAKTRPGDICYIISSNVHLSSPNKVEETRHMYVRTYVRSPHES